MSSVYVGSIASSLFRESSVLIRPGSSLQKLQWPTAEQVWVLNGLPSPGGGSPVPMVACPMGIALIAGKKRQTELVLVR